MKEETMLNDYLEAEATEFEFNSYHRMPSRNHGLLQTRIAGLLDAKYSQEYSILSAVDLDLTSGKAVPDVAIYPKMTPDWEEDETKLTTAPLTAIEIISPKQAFTDLTSKNNKIYFPAGTRSAWIVMPSVKGVMVFAPGGREIYFNTGVLKDPATGVELAIADIFR